MQGQAPLKVEKRPATLLDDMVRRTLRVAASKLEQGAANDAFALYATLVGFQPANKRALRGLALAAIRARRRQDAVAFLAALQKAQPRNADLLEMLLALTGLDSSDENQEAYSRMALQMACLRPHVSRPAKGEPKLRVLVLNSLVKGQYQFNSRSRALGISAGHNNLGTLFDREAVTVEVLSVDPLVVNPALIGPLVPKLPKVDLVYCAISAADRADPELQVAHRIVAALKVPAVNPPEAILQTRREAVFTQLKDAPGLIAVNSTFIPSGSAVEANSVSWFEDRGLTCPLIVRAAGYQGGRHTHVLMSSTDVLPELPTNRGLYVIRYHDVSIPDAVPGFEAAEGAARLFPKYRAFWVGGELIPIHLFVADGFNVHKKNADPVMATRPWVLEQQQAFIDDPDTHFASGRWQQLKAGMAQLGLDYVGVDFAPCSSLGDDRLVIFEANPAMRNWVGRLPGSDPIQRQWAKVTRAAHQMLCRRAGREEWSFELPKGLPEDDDHGPEMSG